ncbi:MAG TPA: 4Fe-4S dicluster domain-containing protein [Chloroflexi bacterium]|jgi:2-oxoglutarate ferredoxin oxidoreductase subunit delta|nr:4Fe-4S dicluster domain-containing protein [Chloroflexota bacterium]
MTSQCSHAAVEGSAGTGATHPARPRASAGAITITINHEWCKGCYICVSVCPRDVLAIDESTWTGRFHPVIVAHAENCALCRHCELLCPDLAIEVLAEA